jgi:hypothetical protein
VHRVDRDIPDYEEVNLWQFGRLLWLILSAAHQPDIGPDVSSLLLCRRRRRRAAFLRSPRIAAI